MRLASSLALMLLLTGCQSFATRALTVPESEASSARAIVERISTSLALKPCSEYQVTVEGSDQCFGGRIGETSVTIASYKEASFFIVKIGLYAVGRPDEDWSEIVEKYRVALSSGLGGTPIAIQTKAAPIKFSPMPSAQSAASAP
jgi:hypothetical protein